MTLSESTTMVSICGHVALSATSNGKEEVAPGSKEKEVV